ncbi:MAG TPA: RodZ domain-containing protein [Ignavibacteriaceae bacterium]
MLDKFADELRQQRESAGLTLQQMATKTRIDLKFLEAIDQGNFSFLPDLYVKAFVKQYAKTIGLDENITLKKFEAAREGMEYDPNPPAPVEEIKKEEAPKVEPPKTESPRPAVKSTSPLKSYVDDQNQKSNDDEGKANKQLMIFGLGGVGLIIIAALLYFFVFNKSDKIIVEETPIEEVIEQGNKRYVEEEPVEQITSDSSFVPLSGDSLYLTFYAKESSWIFVVLDNNRTQEFTLSPNSKFSVAASREFKATVGNSGGVTLHLNNQPVDFTGRPGSVKYFKLNKDGIVYLNTPPKIEQ